MNNKEREYYKERVEETVNDLVETIASKQRILIAKTIDWLLFFGGAITLAIIAPYQSILVNKVTIVIAYTIIYSILRILSRGISVGSLLMNLRFVSVRTKKRASLQEYILFWKKLLSFQMKYTEFFHYYFSYDNRLAQNVPMKRVGFIIVDVSEFKKYRKIYEYNKQKLQSLES